MEIFTKNSAKCTVFQSTICNKISSLMLLLNKCPSPYISLKKWKISQCAWGPMQSRVWENCLHMKSCIDRMKPSRWHQYAIFHPEDNTWWFACAWQLDYSNLWNEWHRILPSQCNQLQLTHLYLTFWLTSHQRLSVEFAKSPILTQTVQLVSIVNNYKDNSWAFVVISCLFA
jgi:hypothetical protein